MNSMKVAHELSRHRASVADSVPGTVQIIRHKTGSLFRFHFEPHMRPAPNIFDLRKRFARRRRFLKGMNDGHIMAPKAKAEIHEEEAPES